MERPPRVAVVQAGRSVQRWHTTAGKWTAVAPTGMAGRCWAGHTTWAAVRSNREGLLGKPPAIRARPRLRPNRDALGREGGHAGTAQVPAIHLDLREWPMLDDVGLQQGQGVVLGLVGGTHHDPDDQIGVDEFHDMAFVTGEALCPRFAPMAHLRVQDERLVCPVRTICLIWRRRGAKQTRTA
jgi:hypothetical protein